MRQPSMFDIENRKWLDRNRGVGLDDFSKAMQNAGQSLAADQTKEVKPNGQASDDDASENLVK